MLFEGNLLFRCNKETLSNIEEEDTITSVSTAHVMILLVNLDQHENVLDDMSVCMPSLCNYSSIQITLHIVTDIKSKAKVSDVVRGLGRNFCKGILNVKYHDIEVLAEQIQPSLMKVFEVELLFNQIINFLVNLENMFVILTYQ